MENLKKQDWMSECKRQSHRSLDIIYSVSNILIGFVAQNWFFAPASDRQVFTIILLYIHSKKFCLKLP